jgi:hypothetical protein
MTMIEKQKGRGITTEPNMEEIGSEKYFVHCFQQLYLDWGGMGGAWSFFTD